MTTTELSCTDSLFPAWYLLLPHVQALALSPCMHVVLGLCVVFMRGVLSSVAFSKGSRAYAAQGASMQMTVA